MKLNVTVDIRRALERVQAVEKQMKFATAVALTRTAKDVERALRDELRSEIDRPTPYTLKSTYTDGAKPSKLEATVWFKNRSFGKNRRSSSDILGHLFTGGTRKHKALEEWLMRAGYISPGEFVAPGEAAKLDQYGNLSRGQIAQILSQLKAGADPTQYATKSKRSRRNQQRAGVMFWSRGGKLARGAWMRHSFGFGSAVKPILIVVGRPDYGVMFDLDELGRRVSRARFDGHFRDALRVALATAR